MVQVLRSVYDAMISHVLQTPTEESCGLLAGRGDTITRIFQAANVAENRTIRYEVTPSEVLRIQKEIDDAGLLHLGIYHSHPKSPARLSATDRRHAAYPVCYIVISLQNLNWPSVRAYTIHKTHWDDEDCEVREEPIEIVDRLA